MEPQELIKKIKPLIDIYKEKSASGINIFTLKNPKYKEFLPTIEKYFSDFQILVINDVKSAISEAKKEQLIPDFNSFSSSEDSEGDLHYLKICCVFLHVFYRLYKMKPIFEEKPQEVNQFFQIYNNNETYWYRGQSNANFGPVPSIFRNAKTTKLWSWAEIISGYQTKPHNVSLIRKLDEAEMNTSLNPYKTTAFIQHSIGYSPLLDFTKSYLVALSFALSNNMSFANYYGDDACVLALNISHEEILREPKEIDKKLLSSKVQVFKHNEIFINIITNQMWLDLMTGTVSSSISLIDRPTNDRMIFQKGTFILYDNAVIIGNKVFLSENKANSFNKRIRKIPIEVTSKESTYKLLMEKSPQYHPRYLYDPYLYLSEPDI